MRALTRFLSTGMILSVLATLPALAQTTRTIDNLTFYGWPDNSPPGNTISHPVIHSVAGGTGTSNDPITFATDINEFSPGTVVYVPFLQKYFIMEDTCVSCSNDFQQGIIHIDLWTGGDGRNADAQIRCEDSLTRNNVDVIVNPDPNQPVSDPVSPGNPLFDPATGACFQP